MHAGLSLEPPAIFSGWSRFHEKGDTARRQHGSASELLREPPERQWTAVLLGRCTVAHNWSKAFDRNHTFYIIILTCTVIRHVFYILVVGCWHLIQPQGPRPRLLAPWRLRRSSHAVRAVRTCPPRSWGLYAAGRPQWHSCTSAYHWRRYAAREPGRPPPRCTAGGVDAALRQFRGGQAVPERAAQPLQEKLQRGIS